MTRKSSLFSIFFTFAVDNLGATIVFPIFAPLFLDEKYALFDPSRLQTEINVLASAVLMLHIRMAKIAEN